MIKMKIFWLLLLTVPPFQMAQAYTSITLNPDKVCLYSFNNEETLKVCAERKKVKGVDKLVSLWIEAGNEKISAENSLISDIYDPELNTLRIGWSSTNAEELAIYLEFAHEVEKETYKSVFFLWQGAKISRSSIVENEL